MKVFWAKYENKKEDGSANNWRQMVCKWLANGWQSLIINFFSFLKKYINEAFIII